MRDHWCVFITRAFIPWFTSAQRRQHDFGTVTRKEPDSRSLVSTEVHHLDVDPADLWRARKQCMEFFTRREDPRCVSNSQRRYHFFSDVGTKLKYAGCNEAVPVGVDSDIFSRIGLTICCSDP